MKHALTIFNPFVRVIVILYDILFLPLYEYLLVHLLCFEDEFSTVHRNVACFHGSTKLLYCVQYG